MYKSYKTETFRKIFNSLDKKEQEWIISTKNQLEQAITGKPLQFEWFREKKYENKRLYFIVNEKLKKLLFISFASKKDQQKIINFVIKNRDELFNFLENIKIH